MISKLALGTVQFGTVYGIKNRTGRIPEKEAAAILARAGAAGVEMLDTAQTYGDSEAVLGRIMPPAARFRIVSKFSAVPGVSVKALLESSLSRLRVNGLYSFLYHKFSDFRERPEGYRELLELKAAGLIEKTGFSVYYPSEIRLLLDGGVKFDLVQLPYSVFDRRFEPLLPELKKAGVEVHARSVFLQGAALMKPEELPAGLSVLGSKLKRLEALSAKAGIPRPALCLCFALLNAGIDRVVIGVDGAADLEANLAGAGLYKEAAGVCAELGELEEKDENFLLPFKWKK